MKEILVESKTEVKTAQSELKLCFILENYFMLVFNSH